jgi:hypothetical protein
VQKFTISSFYVIARALARGNAAIKPRAESNLFELCLGGAVKTEGQSSFVPFVIMNVVKNLSERELFAQSC